ncbi:hypothetical protein HYD_0190 [Candidatus Hydrogenosomobacter endosymbioticus]|uniref:Uncharacterized protein n=2 Tax=Candidatus Hydrogenosomobacter endosymbioticus TaxID=2558174 RepID=A0ABM7V8U0_9PROT|nr:hypothetical protein HYD_0190 [Candidatus Hydrogenosomobacter endosymbioticus]
MAVAVVEFIVFVSVSRGESTFTERGSRYELTIGNKSLILNELNMPKFTESKIGLFSCYFEVQATRDSDNVEYYSWLYDDLDKQGNFVFTRDHRAIAVEDGYSYETDGGIDGFFSINTKIHGNETELSDGSKDQKITITSVFTALDDLKNVKIGSFNHVSGGSAEKISKTYKGSENCNFICAYENKIGGYPAVGVYVQPSDSPNYKTFSGYGWRLDEANIGSPISAESNYRIDAFALGSDSDPESNSITSFSMKNGEQVVLKVCLRGVPGTYLSSTESVDEVGKYMVPYPPTPSRLSLKEAVKLWFETLISTRCPIDPRAAAIWRQIRFRVENLEEYRKARAHEVCKRYVE